MAGSPGGGFPVEEMLLGHELAHRSVGLRDLSRGGRGIIYHALYRETPRVALDQGQDHWTRPGGRVGDETAVMVGDIDGEMAVGG